MAILSPEALKEEMDKALSFDMEALYINGALLVANAVDMTLVLKTNDRPIVMANASYSFIKTMASQFAEAVADYERRTGATVLTMDEINQKLSDTAPGL